MSDLDISDDGDEPLDEHGWQGPFERGMYSQLQSNLIIVTSTSVFKCSVWWCQCANSSEKYVQLLHVRLFPASFKNPKTTFTFEVLDHFWVDTLECKTAAMNFMRKIQQISNEAFPSDVAVGIRLFGWLYCVNDNYRTAIGNYFESPVSGGICTIRSKWALFMINQMFPLMVGWQYFVQHAHTLVSISLLRVNGNQRISFVLCDHLLQILMDDRLLYWPQPVVYGNMKLVHLFMKWPEANVSLSDGELFMVKCKPYADHVTRAPQHQPVGLYIA